MNTAFTDADRFARPAASPARQGNRTADRDTIEPRPVGKVRV
ncbi:hypothetical protein ABZ611_30520 [Streptomyces sp. NPDC007861]